MLICGASFAGLAVARELAGSGADVLIVDRYEVGERRPRPAPPPPRGCTRWASGAIRQEIPHMAFHTPHGSARYRLPWSWSSFDYRELCRLLFAQCDARFEIAKVEGRDQRGHVVTDRGVLEAPEVVDALGWRRVLAARGYQPPEAPLSRGLEVHPDGGGTDLDVWVDRSLVRRGYCWSVPGRGRAAGGLGLLRPAPARQGADRRAGRAAWAWTPCATRATGSPTACATRPRTASTSSATRPATASRCRARASAPRSTSASPAGASCGRWSRARASRPTRWRNYRRFSAGHGKAFSRALKLQRLIPALPPRVLTLALKLIGAQPIVDRAFGWYLDQAHPSFARLPPRAAPS